MAPDARPAIRRLWNGLITKTLKLPNVVAPLLKRVQLGLRVEGVTESSSYIYYIRNEVLSVEPFPVGLRLCVRVGGSQTADAYSSTGRINVLYAISLFELVQGFRLRFKNQSLFALGFA